MCCRNYWPTPNLGISSFKMRVNITFSLYWENKQAFHFLFFWRYNVALFSWMCSVFWRIWRSSVAYNQTKGETSRIQTVNLNNSFKFQQLRFQHYNSAIKARISSAVFFSWSNGFRRTIGFLVSMNIFISDNLNTYVFPFGLASKSTLSKQLFLSGCSWLLVLKIFVEDFFLVLLVIKKVIMVSLFIDKRNEIVVRLKAFWHTILQHRKWKKINEFFLVSKTLVLTGYT